MSEQAIPFVLERGVKECGCSPEVLRCIHAENWYIHLAKWPQSHLYQVVEGVLVRADNPHVVTAWAKGINGRANYFESYEDALQDFCKAEARLLLRGDA